MPTMGSTILKHLGCTFTLKTGIPSHHPVPWGQG